MKILSLLLCILLPVAAHAHDHLEIGLKQNTTQLAIMGNATQLATYFPAGEAPSSSLPNFLGSAFATELTFSAFEESPLPAGGAYVRVELLAVSGPVGGAFSFWESGATEATWTYPVGWTATATDQPSLPVSQGSSGYGHRHGRVLTVNAPGVYQVTIRAVDSTANHTASEPFVIQLTALLTPRLAPMLQPGAIRLTFTSRDGLSYDLQRSASLAADDWQTIGEPLDGTGGELHADDPIAGQTRAFYRLIEYQ